MGKVSNRSTLVSPRRRVLKASSEVGVKKNRGSAAKGILPNPPPIQSLVDEDSGFGGDQSLDSDSSLLSAPGNSNRGLASVSPVLPSLAMVPQTGLYSQVKLERRLSVDISGEEAQDLPESLGCKNSRTIPPLISFSDVPLLSSLHSIRSPNTTNKPPMVRIEAPIQCFNRNKKIQKQSVLSQPSLNAQLSCRSSDGSVELKLTNQPEEQHRARYQTEGSRGAVKDEDGKGHPTVKLVGYSKPTVIQVFVGDDSNRTSPHMFYQVCRVSGKNSTHCKEKRVEGTAVIEALVTPNSDMTMSCDCVGILKERNVDVEHRFKAVVSRGRKKSTKCRLVFRTFITLPNGVQETLQVVSRPIACTQPPGIPEICRKSLTSCSVFGGVELFLFGKNFSKDTVVIFQEIGAKSQPVWEQTVAPEKETLQPIHLIVTVPKYCDERITKEVEVQMVVSSGNKLSEPHSFIYLPIAVSKQEQGQEITEEITKTDEPILPKGVSLGALQVNRNYTELCKLPCMKQEVTAVPKSPTLSPVQMTPSPVPVTKPIASPVRVPRIVQNSAANRRAATRSVRTAFQLSNTMEAKNLQATIGNGSQSANLTKTLSSEVKLDSIDEEAIQESELKTEDAKGTVSLRSLVDLLNVVQSLPSGYIEELVRSMKENMSTPSPSVPTKLQNNQPSSNNNALDNSFTAMNGICISNILQQSKVQKVHPQQSLLLSPETSNNKVIPTVTTQLGLWPLTLFPSQSTACGPRVARVTPIASTTVVSSPGLAKTVRVCVAEAPNISLEPPKKKPCNNLITSMDYEIEGVMSAPISSNPITYSSSVQPMNPEVIATHISAQSNVDTTPQPSTTVVQEQTFIHSAPQGTAELSSNLNGGVNSALSVSQQPLYQTMSPTLLRTISQTPQQVNQPLSARVALNQTPVEMNQQLNISSLGQSIQQVGHSLNVALNPTPQEVNQSMGVSLNQSLCEERQAMNVTCIPSAAPEVSQVVIKAEPVQIISKQQPHTNTQELNIAPVVSSAAAVPQPLPTPLFHQQQQPTDNIGASQQLVVGAVISSSANNVVNSLTPQSVVSTALTHSDPLLSQSVAPLQLDPSSTAQPPQRNQPTVESRPRNEVLMTPNSTATQVSMQNEVTSAINLSETELLNYFDPNCFDNV